MKNSEPASGCNQHLRSSRAAAAISQASPACLCCNGVTALDVVLVIGGAAAV